MKVPVIFIVSTLVVFLSFSSSVNAQIVRSPPLPLTLAPDSVNLTDLLTVAGPFQTFLDYLEQTKVIDTFQNQANNIEEGITIFVPQDQAFSSLKKPSLSNLTQEQLKSLVLFHALPHFYTHSEFKNLSQSSPVSTFAGGQYVLNFIYVTWTVKMSSGWSNTKISSNLYSVDPVAVYQVDKVLLPESIFGLPPPSSPTPAPAPSPDIAPVADAPTDKKGDGSSVPSSSNKIIMKYFDLQSQVVWLCSCKRE